MGGEVVQDIPMAVYYTAQGWYRKLSREYHVHTEGILCINLFVDQQEVLATLASGTSWKI